jgi:hypothetical protein
MLLDPEQGRRVWDRGVPGRTVVDRLEGGDGVGLRRGVQWIPGPDLGFGHTKSLSESGVQ